MWVKVCGVKNEQELIAARGGDAVGFISGVTHFSEDAIEPDHVFYLKNRLGREKSVLVTHLSDPEEILGLWRVAQTDIVQLHGEVGPDTRDHLYYLKDAPFKTIKAVHVSGPESINVAAQFSGISDMILLDTKTETRLGGSGVAHDWDISAAIAAKVPGPVILAGGLTPGNVSEAIRRVSPFGVDANSGLDDSRVKSPELVQNFIAAAKNSTL